MSENQGVTRRRAKPELDPRATRIPRQRGRGNYRGDIDGLRGLAITLVIGFHLFLGGVSGGVDVFFVLSAYLLTLGMLGRAISGQPLGIAGFYVRTFARLKPLEVTVVLVTITAVWVLSPATRWAPALDQGIAAVAGFANFHLAAASVDYYTPSTAVTTPLQHLWSLSVQAQVFVVWPVLLFGARAIARRLRWHVVTTTAAFFCAICVLSFTYACFVVTGDNPAAYFQTETRLWQFAAGSLAACAVLWGRQRPRPKALPASAALIACGVLLICATGFIARVTDLLFPGPVAAGSVLGAVLILVSGDPAGAGDSNAKASTVLTQKWLCLLGRHSYGLYLWHWPVLMLWLQLTEAENVRVGAVGGVVVCSLTTIVHVVSQWALRRTVARLRPARQLICVLAVAAVVLTLAANLLRTPQNQHIVHPALYPGARVLAGAATLPAPAPFIPSPTGLDAEWVQRGVPCTHIDYAAHPALDLRCSEYGDPNAADMTITVVGDSHAQQLLAPLLVTARERSWHVRAYLLGSCRFTNRVLNTDEPLCEAFLAATREYIEADPGDLLITHGTMFAAADAPEQLIPGQAEVLRDVIRRRIPVVLVRDNPRFAINLYECAVRNAGIANAGCAQPVGDTLIDPEMDLKATVGSAGWGWLDLTDTYCPGSVCSPVIGNVAVYMDDNHITSTYGETMAGEFDRRLQQALREAD